MKPKVVFDTNIYISAILYGGNPRSCLELARSGQIELFASSEIIFELVKKLKEKFNWSDEDTVDLVQGLAKFTIVIKPKEKILAIHNDPTDNIILECAKEAEADFIISGDIKHVLALKKYGNTRIIRAKDFLDQFYK